MTYRLFFGTNLKSKEANYCLADAIRFLIDILASDKNEKPLFALMAINDSGYYCLDDYIDIPSGEKGDILFLNMENKISLSLSKFVNTYTDLIELLKNREIENKEYSIFSTKNGIWVKFDD